MLLACPGYSAYVWLREILSGTAKLRLERETMTISGESRLESAAEEIGSNEDLVREILLRLPVNSLLRFKSVSKKWFSLISDPYFSHNYTLRRNPNLEPSGLLLDHDYAGLQFVPFNDDGDQARVTLSCPNEPGIMILQSCNGLLMCCSSIFTYWKEKYHIFKRYICNPTTKQFTTIRFPSPEFEASAVAVNLAFDPLKSPHYKLVCVRMVDEEETLTYQIDIYSSETGYWRPPISADPLIFTSPEDIAFKAPVYCRSAIHWYSDGETSLYFDTDTECLKTMPMPPLQEGFDYHNVRYFGESRGHLHLIVINKPSALEFDILEMETDYSGWFVRYRVNLDALVITFPEVTQNHIAFSVLCVIRAEKEKESTLVLFVSGKAISFNLHDKTSKKLCDFVSCDRDDESTLDYEWSDAYQYIKTLFYI